MKKLKLSLIGIFMMFSLVSFSQDNSSKKEVTVVFLATINPQEQDALNYYFKYVQPMFTKVGGKDISQYKITEKFLGDDDTQIIAISTFPSKKVMDNFFNSKEYQKLVPYRDKAFKDLDIFIVNKTK